MTTRTLPLFFVALFWVVSALGNTFSADYFRQYIGDNARPSSTQRFFAQALRGNTIGIRASRGVIMQAAAKFSDADLEPIKISELRLDYRATSGGTRITCVLRKSANICHQISLEDELVWRIANWVALGKQKAFTYVPSDVHNAAQIHELLESDGMVETRELSGEYVAGALAQDQLIDVLQYIDYSEHFSDGTSNDPQLVASLVESLGLQPPGVAPELDSTYTNSDLTSEFVVVLTSPLKITGHPVRYYWTAEQGQTHVRPTQLAVAHEEPERLVHDIGESVAWITALSSVLGTTPVDVSEFLDKYDLNHSVQAAVNSNLPTASEEIDEARIHFDSETQWIKRVDEALDDEFLTLDNLLASYAKHRLSIDLFRVTALFRAFAYHEPDRFIEYLSQLASHHALLR